MMTECSFFHFPFNSSTFPLLCALSYADPDDLPNPNIEVIEGMWLGASVASQSHPGGRVLVSIGLLKEICRHLPSCMLELNKKTS